MIKRLTLLVVMLLVSIPVMVSLPNQVFAQTVDTAWVRMYNGLGNGGDYAVAIAVDGSGNAYVTGYSVGSGDCATIKYYPNGDTAWVRRYNVGGFAIAVDGSGNVYVTGVSEGIGTSYDYATIKYYPNGDTAWVRRYNGPANGDDMAGSIALDGFNNVYVTGCSDSTGSYQDYATIKYDSSGNELWVKRYNGPPGNGRDEASAIAVDCSSYVFVTGLSYGIGTERDYATIKYKPNGDTAWVRRYNGADREDLPNAIALDDSGNVIVTGASFEDGPGWYCVTIKYYPDGDTCWVRKYLRGGSGGGDRNHAISTDDSNNVYVTGGSNSSGTNDDYTTIKYYPNGDIAWVREYDGPSNGKDWAKAIAVDDSGNVYVTGRSDGGGTGDDYATIKYYSNGDSAWLRRYNGPGNSTDYPSAITVDRSGNVYVTGVSTGSGTGCDYCTIKYVKKTSDVEDETGTRERPSEFGLSQNYPNPFNQGTKIEFTLSKSGFVTLQIYDLLGRKVRTLVSERLSPGYISVFWDGKNDAGKDVASGVYFYQLRVGDFSKPKKMLLLK